MEDFDEEAQQKKDMPYVDGFNLGYQLEKQAEDKTLSKKDKDLISSMTRLIGKSKSENDKIQGMFDGRIQRVQEREFQKDRPMKKKKDKDRDRHR